MNKQIIISLLILLNVNPLFSQSDSTSTRCATIEINEICGHWKFIEALNNKGEKVDRFQHEGGSYELIKRTDYLFLKSRRFNANQIVSKETNLDKKKSIGNWTFSKVNCELTMSYDKPFYPFPEDMEESQRDLLIKTKAIPPIEETFVVVHSLKKRRLILIHNTYGSGKLIGQYLLVYKKKFKFTFR